MYKINGSKKGGFGLVAINRLFGKMANVADKRARCNLIFVSILTFYILGTLLCRGVVCAYKEQDVELETKKKQEAKEHIQITQQEKKKTLAQKEENDRHIEECENEINDLGIQIAAHQEKILGSQRELNKLEKEIAKKRSAFKGRIRFIHENGNVSYLEALFLSENFSDFLSRLEIVMELASYDKKIINSMGDMYRFKAQNLSLIEKERAVEEAKKHKLSLQKTDLDDKNKENAEYMKKLSSDEIEYTKAYEAARCAEKMMKEQINLSRSNDSRFVGNGFLWPVPSCGTITSAYGTRYHPIFKENKFHSGIDIGASYGAPIVASNSGIIKNSGWNSGYGNCVVVDHGGGKATLYGHLSSISVSPGQHVDRGNVIGKVGSSGMSTGPHLHFEVLVDGAAQNPQNYVSY